MSTLTASRGPSRQDLLIVFARALRPGKVKTRLMPAVGETGALQVYRQLLDVTLRAAQQFPGDVALYTDHPDVALAARARRAHWDYRLQQGGDLGERMTQALTEGLTRYRRVLLVGSDCPLLDGTYFQRALRTLNEADVVLGPSDDGGYVLLGSANARLWKRNPFLAVRWGTEHALADSVHALGQHTRRLATLAPLWDVDEPADLERAIKRGLISGWQPVLSE